MLVKLHLLRFNNFDLICYFTELKIKNMISNYKITYKEKINSIVQKKKRMSWYNFKFKNSIKDIFAKKK